MKWQNALKDYQHYLKLERGLSDNSIKNYSLDLIKLTRYLDVNEIQVSPIKISDKTIQEFIYSVSMIARLRSPSFLLRSTAAMILSTSSIEIVSGNFRPIFGDSIRSSGLSFL